MRRFFVLISIAALLALGLASEKSYAQSTADKTANKGLTFTTHVRKVSETPGVFTASCGEEAELKNHCNPYQGDTECSASKPLLCILDIDAPVPETMNNPQHWTGGVIALSSPVSGERFSRLSDANAYCEATFGDGWRVASFHDGGGWTLKGYGVPQHSKKRFWIDIKNQPKGTCWSR